MKLQMIGRCVMKRGDRIKWVTQQGEERHGFLMRLGENWAGVLPLVGDRPSNKLLRVRRSKICPASRPIKNPTQKQSAINALRLVTAWIEAPDTSDWGIPTYYATRAQALLRAWVGVEAGVALQKLLQGKNHEKQPNRGPIRHPERPTARNRSRKKISVHCRK